MSIKPAHATSRYVLVCRFCNFFGSVRLTPEEIAELKLRLESKLGRSMFFSSLVFAPCPSCGNLSRLNKIQGKFSAKKKCNSTCREAKSSTCTCACAGENHGAGHEVDWQELQEKAPKP